MNSYTILNSKINSNLSKIICLYLYPSKNKLQEKKNECLKELLNQTENILHTLNFYVDIKFLIFGRSEQHGYWFLSHY